MADPSPQPRRGVFLDRDGVLNRVVPRGDRPGSPRGVAELELVPGARAAVARLRAAGWLVFVVTNQPDLARGLLSRADHEAIMERVRAAVEPDGMAFCPHDDDDGCSCRKPRPGMLTELARRWDLEMTSSYMVGDGWKDMVAGRAAGCRTVLIRAAYNGGVAADAEAGDVVEAVDLILGAGGVGR